MEQAEAAFNQAFINYLGIEDVNPISVEEAQQILQESAENTQIPSALIYAIFEPSQSSHIPWRFDSTRQIERTESQTEQDQLILILVTPEGAIVRKRIENATKKQIIQTAQDFQAKLLNPRRPDAYLPSAQQLYQWLIAPLETELKRRKIENLVFILDTGLRSLPIAALHDGQRYFIERYSMAVMPSLSLTDFRYRNLQGQQVLAMGASQFSEQNPLPAVPIELSIITNQLWQGENFLNEGFTLENLQNARQEQQFRIIHLATHARFEEGQLANSYIQLWQDKLQLNQLPDLNLNDPPVDLLVLSACQTALGDTNSELGFAGAAVLANVKSVLGSLWEVSDEGTLGLMTVFYESLQTAPTKSQALRQAQLSLLKGEVRLENGQLIIKDQTFALPPVLAEIGHRNLTHPYYWAAFTLIGNPW